MQATTLNPTQLYLLTAFSYMKTEEQAMEMKKVLFEYYTHRLCDMAEDMWQSGKVSQQMLDEINATDLHRL